MSALDKLINLLEEVKITSPDLSDRASQALNVLVSTPNPSPPPLPVSSETEPQIESPLYSPEQLDDSYIEFDREVLDDLIAKQQEINDSITVLGRFELEVDIKKRVLMDQIREKQATLNLETKQLMKTIGCDPAATYVMNIPENDDELPAFKKQ